MRVSVAWVLVATCLAAAASAQNHSSCYLKSKGLLNSGSNPSAAETKSEMQFLAAQYGIPYEVIAAIAYQEGGVRQFASDGYLLHNTSECAGLYNGNSSPNPPGLGMMQLTGGTAQSFVISSLRTDWKYNLKAGISVLSGKFGIYKSNAGSTLAAILDANKNVIENWYFPCWYYNGYVGNYGSYADKIFSHIKNRPGILSTLISTSISPTYPYNVIGHFFSSGPFGASKGDPFAANSSGSWKCYHGNNYSAPVHTSGSGTSSGGGSTTPPPPTTTTGTKVVSVNTSSLNVRSGPGTGYGIIGTIPSVQKYVSIAQQSGWYKIWYNGSTGWIYGGYASATSGYVAKCTTTTLNVRTGPGTGYSLVGSMSSGQIYFLQSSTDWNSGWNKLYFKSGSYYSYAAYMSEYFLN